MTFKITVPFNTINRKMVLANICKYRRLQGCDEYIKKYYPFFESFKILSFCLSEIHPHFADIKRSLTQLFLMNLSWGQNKVSFTFEVHA